MICQDNKLCGHCLEYNIPTEDQPTTMEKYVQRPICDVRVGDVVQLSRGGVTETFLVSAIVVFQHGGISLCGGGPVGPMHEASFAPFTPVMVRA